MIDPKELKRIADRLYEISDEMGTEESPEEEESEKESPKKEKEKKGVDPGKKSAIMIMLQKKAKKGE